MINFVTLNTIVNDLLNVVRSSKVSRSEPISKRQIEMWVHQYRAILIKQDLSSQFNKDFLFTYSVFVLRKI